ncbi:MAG: pilus assembly protein [Rhizobiales bacterium]|nr:pilus assembly protein [Hyphomicrobiales bacterium]
MGAVRRLARQEDGSAAVEFGLVAMPFLALMFAIIETALVFFAGQVLETAAADSARLIMTGQAQGLNKDTFKEKVCEKIYGLFDCQSGVHVDVQTFSSFANVDLKNPVDEDGKLDTSGFKYAQSKAEEIVVVRLIYQWPIAVAMLGLSNMAGNNRLMMATAAFRNEPF